MAEDWLADVRKYAPHADESVVDAIIKYCGIALRNRDSSLVSFTDPAETGRVRENYLKKKLGLTHDDSVLDAGIASVGEQMKGERNKNRVTVYYLLAEHFGLLNIFGGVAKVAPLAAGAAAGVASAAAAAAVPPIETVRTPDPIPQAAYSTYEEKPEAGGIGRWLPWLLLALLALAILYALSTCSNRADDTATTAVPAETGDATVTPSPVAAAIPTGAGVIPEERDGHPMLTVYFETDKSEVHNDLSTAASAVKNYVDTHPEATLAVSGFNDPTGNAAANAELSKNRAESVKAALEGLGIPATRVILVKPVDTTGTGDTNAESRRVEVVVQD